MAIKRFTSKTKTSKVSNFTIEYLIVAGGGGSKSPTGCCTGTAGAGAGGFIEGTYQAARGVTYPVVVGAGGSAARGNSSSVFGIAAAGGGTGTAYQTVYVGSGGSGGGGGFAGVTSPAPEYIPGTGITGQGNNGGKDASLDPDPGGGGGGGAGAAGGNSAAFDGYTGNNPYAGNGGIGKQSSITGTATYYAGGGGASIRDNAGSTHPSKTFVRGTGGSGGGGNGSIWGSDNGSNGTANTGGGAGGSRGVTGSATRSGGSGVVILRAGIAATSTTGSPTYTTSGGWHIYQFNGDGSITY